MSVARATCALLFATICGCSCAGSNGVPRRDRDQEEEPVPRGESKSSGKTLRVGNQAAGVDEQPDYDRDALAVREEVQGQLPDPLPTPKLACVAMYDAVIAAYSRSEGAGSPPVRTLEKTKRDGIATCQSETSPAAASCVAVLASSDGGEFPWLLDQCSRAFP